MKRVTIFLVLCVATAGIAGESPFSLKLLAQPNTGMVRRPQIWNAQQIAEHPFSLHGYSVELSGFKYYDQEEIAAGLSKVCFICGSKFVSSELSVDQISSINRSGRMFVTVQKQMTYSGIVPLVVVGTAYRYEGLKPEPIFYWK